MGVDLTLLPFDADFDTIAFSHTVLPLDRDSDFWGTIQKLPTTPLPPHFTSFLGKGEDGEHRYGVITEDSYGEPLRCVTVERLLRLSNHPSVQRTPKNRAAWAYLRELPSDTRVVLYWC